MRVNVVGVEDRPGDQAGDGGVQAGRGDQIVLAGAEHGHAVAGVRKHGEVRRETHPVTRRKLVQRAAQLARNGSLARPTVDKQHARRIKMSAKVAQCRLVKAHAADDAHGEMGQVKAVDLPGPASH